MSETTVDILLVGGGVMSATLGLLLRELEPSLKIMMVEKLDQVALESSDGWNNAGTGHAGYCELNYTPINANGEVEIKRALAINSAFETSLQFWSHLVKTKIIASPKEFINPTPHASFVWGDENVDFLRKRHAALSAHHLFADMEFSEDPAILKDWMPLVMAKRDSKEKMAGTRVAYGSDIDFGALTRLMVNTLQAKDNFELLTSHQVSTFRHKHNHRWEISIEDIKSGKKKKVNTGFVFLGAGGGALPLLQKSRVAEGKGYGGFPVSGQWLVCQNPEIINQHFAKVYGKAPLGAPPMSVPHLDTRIINGKRALLFGPYAGFTTKFLKTGSVLDLISSVKSGNLKAMFKAGMHNRELTKYLVGEVFQTHKERVDALRQFLPQAKESDWVLANAGQRVQIIKNCDLKGGKLEFGTEIVAAKDASLAALLGASPGASTSVEAMIQVIERCFASKLSHGWQTRLKELIPAYGESLIEDKTLLKKVRKMTLKTLELILP
jgi:malate dehydrogenase (quinone)